MRNILITLEYDGTNYHGWQRQKNAVGIQEVVETAIEKVTGEAVTLIASGRTDAGVHAFDQKANFKTDSCLPADKFSPALNGILPADIRVIDSRQVDMSFHARYSATGKKYRYRIYNGPNRPAIYRNYCVFIPIRLDVDAMFQGALLLKGRHDFSSFCGSGSCVKSRIRTIKTIELIRERNMIDLVVEADGFLYNMVRIIAGTLVQVGKGKLEPSAVKEILDGRDRRLAGPTLPPHGLFLEKVYYDGDY
jgi:tRNA pseudouridine38-40 synthase